MANTAPNAQQVICLPTSNTTSTNVQGALAELSALVGPIIPDLVFTSISALKAHAVPADGTIAMVTGYYAAQDGGEGQFVYVSASTMAADNGIFFIPDTLPATGRWYRLFDRQHLSARWYGAKGDNSTDDTTAIQNAINAGISYQISVRIPGGTYIVQPLTYPSTGYASQVSIYGDNQLESILKKKSGASTAPILTIGSAAATNFTAGVTIENITFDGRAKASTTDAVKSYDLVRSTFRRCTFKNSASGYTGAGGIYITFEACSFDSNNFGVVFDKFVSAAGGGWPNAINMNDCFLINNSTWGAWFDNGRLFALTNCEIEGNGTNGVNTTGGVRMGPNIGAEGGGATPNSIGLRGTNLWCEANAGAASIVFLGGKNSITSAYFVANPNATYDVYIDGGYYHLDRCLSDTSKTPNVFETASVSSGNWINACSFQNLSYNAAKTKIDYGTVAATPIYWSFYNNADYAATTGVDAVATLNSMYILSGGTHAGNPFQVATAGTYRVSACIQIFGIGAGNYIYAQILKNGAIVHLGPIAYNATGGVAGMRANVSALIVANAGDTIGMGYFCSGAAGPTVESDYVATYFQGEMV